MAITHATCSCMEEWLVDEWKSLNKNQIESKLKQK